MSMTVALVVLCGKSTRAPYSIWRIATPASLSFAIVNARRESPHFITDCRATPCDFPTNVRDQRLGSAEGQSTREADSAVGLL